MAHENQPVLSVIVAATAGRAATRRVLGDLAAQQDAPHLEVIVVDGTGTLIADDLRIKEARCAKLLLAPGADVAVMRAVGMRASSGQLLAFTEDLCRIPPEWCNRLMRARAAGHRAFGGAIGNGSYRSPSDWAAYFVEFGPFMPPLVNGPARGLPGMNVAYERQVVDDLVQDTLCEPIVNEQLRARGISLHCESDLLVVLEHRFGVGTFARHCFAGGRTFAELRLAGVPRLRRAAFAAAAAIALPCLLTARATRLAFARQWARAALITSFPWVALYSTAWALGEASGALGWSPSPASIPSHEIPT